MAEYAIIGLGSRGLGESVVGPEIKSAGEGNRDYVTLYAGNTHLHVFDSRSDLGIESREKITLRCPYLDSLVSRAGGEASGVFEPRERINRSPVCIFDVP